MENQPPLRPLEESVQKSVEAMPWLTDSDSAAVSLAKAYAARIADAVDSAEGQELTKALYLGPHLLNTLKALGGSPAERKALMAGIIQEVDPIDELKAKRGRKATG